MAAPRSTSARRAGAGLLGGATLAALLPLALAGPAVARRALREWGGAISWCPSGRTGSPDGT
jgi:hypothetical protein